MSQYCKPKPGKPLFNIPRQAITTIPSQTTSFARTHLVWRVNCLDAKISISPCSIPLFEVGDTTESIPPAIVGRCTHISCQSGKSRWVDSLNSLPDVLKCNTGNSKDHRILSGTEPRLYCPQGPSNDLIFRSNIQNPEIPSDGSRWDEPSREHQGETFWQSPYQNANKRSSIPWQLPHVFCQDPVPKYVILQ